MEKKSYDVIVIGTGDAGKKVAFAASKKRIKVAIIDKRDFGGTCGLRGCYPKKVLLSGVEVADYIERLNNVGVHLGSGIVSWQEIMAWKQSHIKDISQRNTEAFRKRGIHAYKGKAQFVDKNHLLIKDEILVEGKYIHIATGSRPRTPSFPGAEHTIDSEAFLSLKILPKRIIFIGGGFIAFELAHIARRAGATPMILNRSSLVLKQFDQDLVALLEKAYRAKGIIIKKDHPIIKIEKQVKTYIVYMQEKGREIKESADLVVWTGGRVPDLEELDLEKADVAYSNTGITVNNYLQSVSNPSVFSAGDCADTGGPMTTPVALREGEIAAYNILNKTKKSYPDYTYIPRVVFSSPFLARAGHTEKDAKRLGYSFSVLYKNTASWLHNARMNQKYAAVKVLSEKKSRRIIGAHILGEKADEIINLFSFAMQHKMTVKDIKKPLYAYPTAISSVQYSV